MTEIVSDSPFVYTGPPSESSGSSQQISITPSPTVTISGDNTRLLSR